MAVALANIFNNDLTSAELACKSDKICDKFLFSQLLTNFIKAGVGLCGSRVIKKSPSWVKAL